MVTYLMHRSGLFNSLQEGNRSLYENLYYTLEIFKKISNMCDFDRILKTECNLLHFTRNCRVKNLADFEVRGGRWMRRKE